MLVDMDLPDHAPELALERFRPYLRFLAESHLGRFARGGLEASDLVQQTLLVAHRRRGTFRGKSEAELAGWLRRILATSIADAMRARGRIRRGVAPPLSLEAELDRSSVRLGSILAADQSSPSERVERIEELTRLAEGLTSLSEATRRALILRYCHGFSLSEIAETLGRTPMAVAGLLKRGLSSLREFLAQPESGGP